MRRNHLLVPSLIWVALFILVLPSRALALPPSPRQNISLETRGGYYVMDTSRFEESVFGRKYGIIGGMKVNMEFPKQFLQVGVGAGYMREHEPFYYLYNIPLELSVNARLRFSPDQFIVPYVGGGVDYSYFKQRATYTDPNTDEILESALHNHRSGFHANAGFQVLLNRIGPDSAERFDEKFGVNATYLTFEVRYTDLTNFDSIKEDETDLSGWFYYVGLLFEF
ncbi:MAG: hypothetical protein ACMUIS_09265 [bacterium]